MGAVLNYVRASYVDSVDMYNLVEDAAQYIARVRPSLRVYFGRGYEAGKRIA